MSKNLTLDQYLLLRDALSIACERQGSIKKPFYLKHSDIPYPGEALAQHKLEQPESLIVIPRTSGGFDFVMLPHEAPKAEAFRGSKCLIGYGGTAEVRLGHLYNANYNNQCIDVAVRTTCYNEAILVSTKAGVIVSEKHPELYPKLFMFKADMIFSQEKPHKTVVISECFGDTLRRMYFKLESRQHKEAVYCAVESHLNAIKSAGIYIALREFHPDNVLIKLNSDNTVFVKFCDPDSVIPVGLYDVKTQAMQSYFSGDSQTHMLSLWHNLYENFIMVVDDKSHKSWQKYQVVDALENYLDRLFQSLSYHPLPPMADFIRIESLLQQYIYGFQFATTQKKSAQYIVRLNDKTAKALQALQKAYPAYPLKAVVHRNLECYVGGCLSPRYVSLDNMMHYSDLSLKLFNELAPRFFELFVQYFVCTRSVYARNFLVHYARLQSQVRVTVFSKDLPLLYKVYIERWIPSVAEEKEYDLLQALLCHAGLFFSKKNCNQVYAHALLMLCKYNGAFEKIFQSLEAITVLPGVLDFFLTSLEEYQTDASERCKACLRRLPPDSEVAFSCLSSLFPAPILPTAADLEAEADWQLVN